MDIPLRKHCLEFQKYALLKEKPKIFGNTLLSHDEDRPDRKTHVYFMERTGMISVLGVFGSTFCFLGRSLGCRGHPELLQRGGRGHTEELVEVHLVERLALVILDGLGAGLGSSTHGREGWCDVRGATCEVPRLSSTRSLRNGRGVKKQRRGKILNENVNKAF